MTIEEAQMQETRRVKEVRQILQLMAASGQALQKTCSILHK